MNEAEPLSEVEQAEREKALRLELLSLTQPIGHEGVDVNVPKAKKPRAKVLKYAHNGRTKVDNTKRRVRAKQARRTAAKSRKINSRGK